MIHRLIHKRHISAMPSVFLSFLLLSFHAYLIQYINSTFLEQFVSATQVGYFFSAGALITIATLFAAPRLIRTFGAMRVTLTLLTIEFIAVGFLAFAEIPFIILLLFVIYRGVISSLAYIFDLYLESVSSKQEHNTGKIRGLYLTLSNTALIISPSIAGLIAGENNFEQVYIASSLFIIPVILLVMRNLQREAHDIKAPRGILEAIGIFWRSQSLRNILVIRFLLQLFYVFMVIYTPVYLYDVLGFNWKEIGFMLTFMLLPFALFQFPAGYLADKKLGEKELLVLGFIVMATFTYIFSLIGQPFFILLAVILFMSRIGASIIEVMTESYFFKQVDEDNGNLISLFRSTAPLAYVVGPFLGSLALAFVSFEAMFAMLGLTLFVGVFFAMRITDTK